MQHGRHLILHCVLTAMSAWLVACHGGSTSHRLARCADRAECRTPNPNACSESPCDDAAVTDTAVTDAAVSDASAPGSRTEDAALPGGAAAPHDAATQADDSHPHEHDHAPSPTLMDAGATETDAGPIVGCAAYERCAGDLVPAPGSVDMAHDAKRDLLYITSNPYAPPSAVLRWDLKHNRFLEPLLTEGAFLGLGLSPDQNQLVVADRMYSEVASWFHVIDLETGTSRRIEFPTEQGAGGTFTAVFTDDTTVLVSKGVETTGSGGVLEFDLRADSYHLVEPTQNQTMLAISADGSTAAFAASRYDLASGEFRQPPSNLSFREACVSRDGGQIAAPGGVLNIFDRQHSMLASISGDTARPAACAYSPIGDQLYVAWGDSASRHPALDVYDSETLQRVHEIVPGSWGQYAVGNDAFADGHIRISRDGRLLLARLNDGIALYSVGGERLPDSPPAATVECGNGLVEGDEVCDDGNLADGDLCAADCASIDLDCRNDDVTFAEDSGSVPLAAEPSDMVALCWPWLVLAEPIESEIVLFDARSATAMRHYPLLSAPERIAVDRNAGIVYATMRDSQFIARLDLQSAQVTLIRLEKPALDVDVGDGGLLFVKHAEATTVVDQAGARATFQRQSADFTDLIAYEPATNQVIAATRGLGGVGADLERFSFNRDTLEIALQEGTSSRCQNGQGLAVSPAGGHVVYACAGGNTPGTYDLIDFSPTSLTATQGVFAIGGFPSAVDFSRDGSLLALSNRNALQLFAVEQHGLLDEWPIDDRGCGNLFGHSVAISNGSRVVLGTTSCADDGSTALMWARTTPQAAP